jgi:Kef-type K+ transport system membrane component KefB/voltage-gated potassium channel Kch
MTLNVGVALGLILALSSTAIVLQTLAEKGLMGTEAGQSCFAVLLFQDIAVIPILALMPLLAAPLPDAHHAPAEPPAFNVPTETAGQASAVDAGGAHHAVDTVSRPGWKQALLVVGVVAGMVLAGRFLARRAFRFIAETRLRESFTAAALLLVIAIALAMQRVGLSPALGTFLAGVVLADNEYRHELESDIEPFKGLLLGLFFISVGASIDFNLLLAQPGLILVLLVVLVAVKFFLLLGLGRFFRMPLSENFVFSFSLAQGGEFAFVLFSFAIQNRVLTTEVANPLVLAVALSMVATPLLMIAHDKLVQPRFSGVQEEREADHIDETDNPVIIAGFGRLGQMVGRLLQGNGIPTTVLELDPSQIESLRKFGYKVFYGNASRLDLLHAAGAERARLLVLAVDDREASLDIVDMVKKHFPDLRILARAHDRVHAYELLKRGVENVHRETFGAAIDMGVDVLKALGFRAHQAHRLGRMFREHDEDALRAQVRIFGDEKAYILETHRQTEELERVLQSELRQQGLEPDSAWDTDELIENARKDEF